MLMSVVEAKKGENKNVVRFFKEDEFSKPAADESWDRIKLVCSQPFNKQTQYGLSFVKVRTKDEANDVTATCDPTPQTNSSNPSSSSQNSRLGKFNLLKDSEDVSVGSFFARRNDVKAESPSTGIL